MPPTNSVLDGKPVTQYPDIPANRDDDLVISRSRRPALGGVTTAITLHPDDTYTVTGPNFEVGSEDGVDSRAKALAVARKGPEALIEAEADGSAPEGESK